MVELLKGFAAYYRPHRGLFLLDFGSAVAAGLLELAFPVVVTLFIDRLLPTAQIGLIALAALGLLAIYAISAAQAGSARLLSASDLSPNTRIAKTSCVIQ